MLRKRSRQVATSKQPIVGDQSNNNNNNNQWISLEKPTKPSSFFFTSPKFIKGFFTFNHNNNNKIDPMLSPTSILDTNPFQVVANFWVFDTPKSSTNNNKNTQKHAWEQPNNKQGITLALIDETHEPNNNNDNDNDNMNDDDNAMETKQQRRKLVVFGSQLRIQVPNSSVFPCFSPESPPIEFGIKTPRNNLWSFGNKNLNSQVHPEQEIEIDEDSEDYTCVVSHGPNPKTTHIFGNCVVESCCGKIVGSPSKRNGYFGGSSMHSQHVHFLSFCHHCKKNLGHGRDIFMYRGEKAFCSEECRCQGMLFDGGEN